MRKSLKTGESFHAVTAKKRVVGVGRKVNDGQTCRMNSNIVTGNNLQALELTAIFKSIWYQCKFWSGWQQDNLPI